MPYNRSEIMKAAWIIVRRFKGNGEPLRSLLSRALQSAWFTAKMEARVAHACAQAVKEREALAARPSADLWAEIQNLENRTTLGQEAIERLAQIRAAYHVAARREAEEEVQADMEAKRQLISSAKGRFCSVIFHKKDGSKRVMRIQPATLRHHIKGPNAPESARKATETRAQRHPHLLPVWDAEKCAPRSVNLKTVSRIAVNGAVHEYAIQ